MPFGHPGYITFTFIRENAQLKNVSIHEPMRAAQQIIGDLVELRNRLKATAEGFAILDFAQGYVATDLPTGTARDIVAVVRGDDSAASTYHGDLIMFWLENYRRAYSNMIMRVLEDGADQLTV